jgi:hypothetical protein
MHCPSCTTELPDDARFCGGCGERFAEAPAAAHTAPKPAAAPAQRFDLLPEDFARALVKACDKVGIEPPPGAPPSDHPSLFRAAEQAGLTKLDVEKALHLVSIEKLPPSARKAMGVVLEDDVPQPGRPLWLPLVLGINAVALLVGIGAFLVYDPKPPRPEAELKPQRGELELSALDAALDGFAARAEDCYRAALEEREGLMGEVLVTLRIDLEGKAAEAKVARDGLAHEGAVACIVEAARAQPWPRAKIAPVDVDVPLLFSARAN